MTNTYFNLYDVTNSYIVQAYASTTPKKKEIEISNSLPLSKAMPQSQDTLRSDDISLLFFKSP